MLISKFNQKFRAQKCAKNFKMDTNSLIVTQILNIPDRQSVNMTFDINNNIFGVLDVDSDKLNDFDEIDQHWLELLVGLIQPYYSL